MLVTRQPESESSPWSTSKLETIFSRSASISRMSNNYEPPLSAQSDWQGQYSFLAPGESSIFSQSYDHVTGTTEQADSQAQSQSQSRQSHASNNAVVLDNIKTESTGSPLGTISPIRPRRSLDPLGLRQQRGPSPIQEQVEPQDEHYLHRTSKTIPEEPLLSTDTPGLPIAADALGSIPVAGQGAEPGAGDQDIEGQAGIKDEDDEILEDEEMLEGEGEGEGEENAPPQPQTAAERTAQRRKMKRFRLTHQQTRFLMSEFAKQPHPDAAHRERLSREIPGLSPRQVQVWFQNRRAKIKRLTADDRERMMKMRAVPDDFDNVQALHSPYGAVPGLGGNALTSPVDFSGSYGDHMMRPLMVDVRRHGGSGGDDHLSPTGLSPAFGNIGFSPSGGLTNSDILSPLSAGSADRYGYSGHLATPLSAGSRTSNPYARPTIDTSMSMHSHHARQQIRPLQPLSIRDTLTRGRSDSLQSPLRTSMSWKGDAIDYTTYQGGNQSPQMGGRQTSGYDSISGTSTGGLGAYESSYATPTVHSPTHMTGYPSYPSTGMQSSASNRARLRATSSSGVMNLDLRNQFRAMSSGHNMQSSSVHSPGPRTTGVSSSYSGYPSAPLTAPIDYLTRATGFRSSGASDYSMPQMSAPIATSNDFASAFGSLGAASSRTPMRDSFGTGDRNDDYGTDSALGLKRKRSFTNPSSSATG